MREPTAINVLTSAVAAAIVQFSKGLPADNADAVRALRGGFMKNIVRTPWVSLLAALIGGLAFNISALADVQSDEVEQGRQMIREGRLELVRIEIRLTDEEAAAFWPLYKTYRAETDAIQDRYAAMITEYIRRYDNAELTNEYADELIDTFLSIKFELLEVQKKYLPGFREVLPSLKVARLYQLENKLNAEIDAQMALVVPLVDPS
jgi:hypothetical protein